MAVPQPVGLRILGASDSSAVVDDFSCGGRRRVLHFRDTTTCFPEIRNTVLFGYCVRARLSTKAVVLRPVAFQILLMEQVVCDYALTDVLENIIHNSKSAVIQVAIAVIEFETSFCSPACT